MIETHLDKVITAMKSLRHATAGSRVKITWAAKTPKTHPRNLDGESLQVLGFAVKEGRDEKKESKKKRKVFSPCWTPTDETFVEEMKERWIFFPRTVRTVFLDLTVLELELRLTFTTTYGNRE